MLILNILLRIKQKHLKLIIWYSFKNTKHLRTQLNLNHKLCLNDPNYHSNANHASKYKVFTSKFDKTIKLNKGNPLFVQKHETESNLSKQKQIDTNKLYDIILFKKITLNIKRVKNKPYETTILIDKSLSITETQNKIIKQIIKLILTNLPDCKVIGFTTRNWNGGNSYKLWKRFMKQNYCPGRLNDLLYIVYKEQNDKFCYDFSSRKFSKENIDGEALIKHLNPLNTTFLITDNNPDDYITNKLNSNALLKNHMNKIINSTKNNTNLIRIILKSTYLEKYKFKKSEITKNYNTITISKHTNIWRIKNCIHLILNRL